MHDLDLCITEKQRGKLKTKRIVYLERTFITRYALLMARCRRLSWMCEPGAFNGFILERKRRRFRETH